MFDTKESLVISKLIERMVPDRYIGNIANEILILLGEEIR